MELDDLKNAWEGVSNQVEKRHKLSAETIEQITRTKYDARMKKIAYPEIAGLVVCFTAATFIAANFTKLDTLFLQSTGVVAVLLLLALPVISLLGLRQLRMPKDVNLPHAATLKKFVVQKIRFNKLQKANVTLSYLLLVTTIILLPKFFAGKDITDNRYFWILSFPIGYIFLSFFSKWVLKTYNNSLMQAEELLKELES